MEEVELLGETPNDNIKEIELIEGNTKYKCEIKKEKILFIQFNVFYNIIFYKKFIEYKNYKI